MDVANKLINNISKFVLDPLIFLMFGIATVVFLWGINNYIGGADNPEARSKGSQQIIWGMVGMVIMIAAKALVSIIGGTVVVL